MLLIGSTTGYTKLKFSNMEKLQLGIAVLLVTGCIAMFIASICRGQVLDIAFHSIYLIGTSAMLRIAYKEFKEEYHGNKK